MQTKDHRTITNRQDMHPSAEQAHLAQAVNMKIGLHQNRW